MYKQVTVLKVPVRSLYLALKPLRIYHKLSPTAVVKKEWWNKGVQQWYYDASTVAEVDENTHLGMEQH